MILLDSNIIIDIINGKKGSLELLLQWPAHQVFLSVISEWEILAGAKDKQTHRAYRKALSRYNIIELDEKISEQTGVLLKTYFLSHHLQIPDALIASTAIRHNLSLLTLNQKDFRFIQGLLLEEIPAS
jgi:hypothetical protein